MPQAAAAAPWKLEGILVRGRTRAAIIDGVAYRERESIGLNQPAAVPGIPPGLAAGSQAPVLHEIGRDYVIVKWQGQAWRLELERPALAPGDRIVPSGKASAAWNRSAVRSQEPGVNYATSVAKFLLTHESL
jgi:hypothetical protein